jgi:hypothetical protein
MALALAACGPEATPLPVDIPVTEVTGVAPAEPAVMRYALGPNTRGYVAELEQIAAAAEVTTLDDLPSLDAVGDQYALMAALGDLDGGTRSPQPLRVVMILNTTADPFDDPTIADIARRAVNPAAIVAALGIAGAEARELASTGSSALRAELANLGLPDGVDVAVGTAFAPGSDLLTAQLRAAGFVTASSALTLAEAESAFTAGTADLLVIGAGDAAIESWRANAGAANVIDLYTLPISYRAIPGLALTFTPSGWPLPSP